MQQLQNTYVLCSIIYIVLTIISMLGGIHVFKKEVIKATAEIQKFTTETQNHAINAMEQELTLLRSRMSDIETDNKKLDQIILTICEAMKRRGLEITVDRNTVSILDSKDNNTNIVRITGV